MTKALSKLQAKRLWIHAQKLDELAPFGDGPLATQKAVEHLGYVQIDTISVIERCHHHILFSRIPQYKRQDLHQSQTKDKTVFEYWTHALSFVPTKDYRYFMGDMKRAVHSPGSWYESVKPSDLQKVCRRIKKEGAISIRDINDDVLVEKDHEWSSRKPSKKALQLGFYTGRLVVSERVGMLKKYELAKRHFDWEVTPKAASEKETLEYLLDRSLRSQSLVSLESICHLEPKMKPCIQKIIEARVRKNLLVPVSIEGFKDAAHWCTPEQLDLKLEQPCAFVHLLSPFDPLIIQRKRLKMFFDYEHRFEAYVPKEKRVFGYFALPVLINNEIKAVIDLKTDRAKGQLLLQKWTWIGKHKSPANKRIIEDELGRFEKFQLDSKT